MTDNIAELLNRPLRKEKNVDITSDPKTVTRIKVSIDQVTTYDRNPRKLKNPKYEEIKQAIRSRGLDTELSVTRRKPNDLYMMRCGGNTRLEILRELYKETGDLRYKEFYCNFHPWTSDLDNLIGSLGENDNRGDMLFIERALAIREITQELEKEGLENPSVRKLSEELSKLGYVIASSTLNTMVFALDKLFPVIPKAFWGGMGRPSITSIRKFLTNAQKFWDEVATEEEGRFDDIWEIAFEENDDPNFVLEDAIKATEGMMATKLNVPITNLRGEMQALIEGITDKPERPTSAFDVEPSIPSPAIASPSLEQAQQRDTELHKKQAVSMPDYQAEPQNSTNSRVATEAHKETPSTVNNTAKPISTEYETPSNPTQVDSQPVETHATPFDLAWQIAKLMGIEDLIVPANYFEDGQSYPNAGFYLLKPSTKEHQALMTNEWAADAIYQYLYELSALPLLNKAEEKRMRGEVIDQLIKSHPNIDLGWLYEWTSSTHCAYRSSVASFLRNKCTAVLRLRANSNGIDVQLGRLMQHLEQTVSNQYVT